MIFTILTFASLNCYATEYEVEHDKQEDFECDGRKYCSQMTSCEEAIFFINHCPDTKMDGDHDGIPCERQWCGL